MQNLIGQSIDRYHILEQLGEGGMATVYKAYDTRLEREVALKLIRIEQFAPAQLERVLKRFEREAKALARLDHLYIVKIHDFGDFNGAPYLVMQYVPSGSLRSVTGKPVPWRQALHLLLPVANALGYAHEQGMIHRDVKPSNILITRTGEAMLSDFGIAKILEAGEGDTLTTTGMGVGTPEYMAPEQWLNQVSPQTDIYALGVVLYELLTGRKPYTADTPAAVLLKQSNDPLPDPKKYVADLPKAVEQALYKAMAKQPKDRYADMSAFSKALERALTGKGKEERKPEVEKLSTIAREESTREEVKEWQPPPKLEEPTRERTQSLKVKPGIPSWLWAVGAGILIIVLILAWPRPPKVATSTSVPTMTQLSTLSGAGIKACLVTDSAGIGDQSYNDAALLGLENAIKDFGIEASYIESKSADDYAPNIQACLDAEADVIVCVGYMMADACEVSIKANPETNFIGIDLNWLSYPNFLGVDAYVEQTSFLAGYLSAGLTRSGKLATYTGFFVPLVQLYMDGFYMGAMEYNKLHGTSVVVLGYDPEYMDQTAAIGSWIDTEAGYAIAQDFLNNGADIIFPVCGSVGLGSAEAIKDREESATNFKGYILGIGQDWSAIFPEYKDQILASIVKNMDVPVYYAIQHLINENKGISGNYLLQLSNGGISLTLNPSVYIPSDLEQEMNALYDRIISGEIQTLSNEYLNLYPIR